MSIYTPRAFAPREESAFARLAADHPFATLITPGESEPSVSHLPLQYHAESGEHGVLIGHMARANPHWQRFAAEVSIAIFHGPHAYVSPSSYTDPAGAVPTWNYAVAHVHGRVELLSDPADTRALLDEMIARYEAGRAAPWRLQLTGRALAAMLEAIVAFRLVIERVEVKLKLSQNRSRADRERVIAELSAENYADGPATARWMERYALDD